MLTYYKVAIIESERGWGSKIDEEFWFRSKEEAEAYVEEYNVKYNNKPTVPDWYMYAAKPTAHIVDEGLAKLIEEDLKKKNVKS